jgi:oligopeptide/dipeptide ABC transporter ATP-binding protein
MTLLEVIELKKLFPLRNGQRLHAVDGISFTVAEGGSLGIVGESGSGKSTLARLVARLIDPSDGVIRFDGREIGNVPAARFARVPERRAIQLIFQSVEDALNPSFNAARNIAVGLGRTRVGDDALMKVQAIAAEVGLGPDQLSCRPHQLSGGQQARVGIARALMSEPRLLILDEPTASLDVSVQASVLKLIDGLRRRHRIALLFISHDLEIVRLMCERILVLYLGRVAEIGPVEQVLREPRHPYTQALLAATPGRGRPEATVGEPINSMDPQGEACLFHSRCPLAVDRCRGERPVLRDVGERMVACHQSEAIADLGASAPAGC